MGHAQPGAQPRLPVTHTPEEEAGIKEPLTPVSVCMLGSFLVGGGWGCVGVFVLYVCVCVCVCVCAMCVCTVRESVCVQSVKMCVRVRACDLLLMNLSPWDLKERHD